MNPKEIKKRKREVFLCLARQRVAKAIELLRSWLAETGQWEMHDELEQYATNYRLMQTYFAGGGEDPERGRLLQRLVESLFTLADRCAMASADPDANDLLTICRDKLADKSLEGLIADYHTLLNKIALLNSVDSASKDSQAILHLLKDSERVEQDLFNKVWSTFPLPAADASVLGAFIADSAEPEHCRSLLVSALLMGLMKCYDERKLCLLADAYAATDSVDVAMRSVVGLLLGVNMHRVRVGRSTALADHLAAAVEKQDFADDLALAQLLLIRTRNTENLTRRVKEELMPGLVNADPELSRLMRRNGGMLDPADLEANPEWARLLEESGFTQKIEEINRLQAEGNDVFIGAFSHLKSFSFFSALSNWFLSFHAGHSILAEHFGGDNQALGHMVEQAPYLCNSDRYSFCLTLAQMGGDNRNNIARQISAQLSGLEDEMDENTDRDRHLLRQTLANRCVQDLYRFFTLYGRRAEFSEHFDPKMDFTGLPRLEAFTDSARTLGAIAEFYLQNGFYEDAVRYYKHQLEVTDEANPLIQQKLGYAYERRHDYRQALQHYLNYELADENSLWNLRHIALCYRMTGDSDRALDYYRKADAVSPDNVPVNLSIGTCLLELGRIEEALQVFYKVDLIDDKKHRARRPLAWSLFLSGNDPRALEYYDKILAEDGPTAQDHLNRGHVLLAMHHVPEAIESYRQSVAAEVDGGEQEFVKAFNADRHHLLARGVAEADLMLMIDAVTSPS